MDNGKAGNSRYKIDDSTYDTDMIVTMRPMRPNRTKIISIKVITSFPVLPLNRFESKCSFGPLHFVC